MLKRGWQLFIFHLLLADVNLSRFQGDSLHEQQRRTREWMTRGMPPSASHRRCSTDLLTVQSAAKTIRTGQEFLIIWGDDIGNILIVKSVTMPHRYRYPRSPLKNIQQHQALSNHRHRPHPANSLATHATWTGASDPAAAYQRPLDAAAVIIDEVSSTH